MGRARGEEEEVVIFNMSFLDVFCSTVGALIFILIIQVVRTRDMVEREELEKVRKALAAAHEDLASTEKSRESAREELAGLTRAVDDAKKSLAEATADLARTRDQLSKTEATVAEQGKTIEDLMAQLRDPNRPAPASGLSGLSGAPGGQRGSGAMESQKSERGQVLLGNLETKRIVCTADGLYLGLSRRVLSIRENRNLNALFREFLRFHDEKQEGLWRTVWGEGGASLQASIPLELAEQSHRGEGLVVRKDPGFAEAQGEAVSRKAKTVERGEKRSGSPERLYEDTEGDGTLDILRVSVDDDPFFEEVSLDYNPATGIWGRILVDSDGDDQYDVLFQDTVPGNSRYERMYVLPNLKTGVSVFLYEDTDGDGGWDVKYENTNVTNEAWENTYLQFDTRNRRWGAILVDANGDGKPEVLMRDTDMTNDDWEEKLVDENGDGVFDVRWKDLDPRDNDWEVRLTQHKGNTDIWQRCEVDSDADGVFDTMLVDDDGDGNWDEELVRNEAGDGWVKKPAGGK